MTTTRRPAKAPANLAAKRPAEVVGRDDLDDEPSTAERMQAEVEAELDDGSVVVTLSTEAGDADITVPPLNRWRAMARNALFSRGDSLLWASRTLSADDARAWLELDPDGGESDAFFAEWGRLTGQSAGESQASNRASRRTQRR